ncbi:MAG TPA: N-acetyltransferase [Ktedonosporobacter sp.]|nr:N-acetyltransferase [Ktedonosporobacter sp.]
MVHKLPAKKLAIRIAGPEDIATIEELDQLSTSPTRDIHRDMEKYFGSVDPSTHEHTVIFLAEVAGSLAGKAELMLPPAEALHSIGYIKRVVVHPDFRGQNIATSLMEYILTFAHTELHLEAIDLHVWEENQAAIKLYEKLGFQFQHRELYYRLPL